MDKIYSKLKGCRRLVWVRWVIASQQSLRVRACPRGEDGALERPNAEGMWSVGKKTEMRTTKRRANALPWTVIISISPSHAAATWFDDPEGYATASFQIMAEQSRFLQ
ncbi:hypothetical protein WG66_017038 [Moniliophthora roreri]|nr:hypothetical protein WG66_017038 [Moniliophthora roreri]